MSTAPAAEAAPAAKGGKKKLIIIIAVAALVLVGGGVAAMMMMKKKAHDAENAEGEADTHAPAKAAIPKHDPKAVPVFVPLDPFTVNLADKDAERFAQVGITLEIEDAKLGDQIKAYTPAIRHNILMAIADRTAAELMSREGKAKLAEKVRREVSRALGVEVDEEEEEAPEEEKPKAADKKKKKKKKSEPYLPVKAVHFSNFIIQ